MKLKKRGKKRRQARAYGRLDNRMAKQAVLQNKAPTMVQIVEKRALEARLGL